MIPSPRGAAARLALALLLGAAACGGKDQVGPAAEPEIVAVRLQAGTQSITVIAEGPKVIGGPLELPAAGTVQASATFVGANNRLLGLDDDEYELRIEPGEPGKLTFTRSAAFRGALAAAQGATGETWIKISVYHHHDRHDAFGPFTVPVVIGGGLIGGPS